MVPSRQVFLSHTSELQRLPAGRSFVDAAKDAITRSSGTPVEMAYFSADSRPPAQVCQEAVRSADVFVGIVGFRYGSPVSDRPELSYTELEFEETRKASIPRLVFLLGEDMGGHRELFQDVEHGARQQAFRESLSHSGITTAIVTSPEGLSEALHQALLKLYYSGWRGPVWLVPELRGDEINRPDLMKDLVAAVTRPGASAVGMTTGLWGAGGFGNTTPRVRHTYRVTFGAPESRVVPSVGPLLRFEGRPGRHVRESGLPPGADRGVSLAGAGCALR